MGLEIQIRGKQLNQGDGETQRDGNRKICYVFKDFSIVLSINVPKLEQKEQAQSPAGKIGHLHMGRKDEQGEGQTEKEKVKQSSTFASSMKDQESQRGECHHIHLALMTRIN